VPLDELTCGLSAVLPVDDDGLDETDGLADVLTDDDELGAGVAEGVDFAAFVGAELVQLGLGSATVLGRSARSA